MVPSGVALSKCQSDSGEHNVLLFVLRGRVVFPATRHSIKIPSDVYRMVCDHGRNGGLMGAVTLKRKTANSDKNWELYPVGTLCDLIDEQLTDANKPPKNEDSGSSGANNSVVGIRLEGRCRLSILEYVQTQPALIAKVRFWDDLQRTPSQDPSIRELALQIHSKMSDYVSKNGGSSSPMVSFPPEMLVGMIGCTNLQLSIAERQRLLETENLKEQLQLAMEYLNRGIEVRRLEREAQANMQRSREKRFKQDVLQRHLQEVQKREEQIRELLDKVNSHGEDDIKMGNRQEGRHEEDQGEAALDEVSILAKKIAELKLPDDAEKIAKRELRRLQSMQPQHPEHATAYSYLELLVSLPWNASTEDRFELEKAREFLDEDHYGLQKVKTRLLEFLAVQKSRGDLKGPILCLHGPPGIGKTSLGRSIARALGRKFYRISLGGVKDEAEIRGHRRTYIGSMPGSLIQAYRTLGTNNPVILLDEVDKTAKNAMFNPQATLLEVLDPEQNGTFKDHYLNTPFDLSRTLFICTANDTSLVDRPLLDRMEIIDLAGYTVEEKVVIAESHLLPKQRRLHALETDQATSEQTPAQNKDQQAEDFEATVVKASNTVAIPLPLCGTPAIRLLVTQQAIEDLISKWTQECGVRGLERRIAQICRWATLRLQGLSDVNADGNAKETWLRSCGPDVAGIVSVDSQHLPYILGAELYEPDLAERLTVGVAMGMSVTQFGGQLLFVEVSRFAGNGRLVVTGHLGQVMSESVQTALSLVRAAVAGPHGQFGSVLADLYRPRKDKDPFKDEDIHVHFPAGGIPKDGPSAGIAVVLALASVLLDAPVRSDTAFTGEVTLRGHVLPVGGIRDKVLAAKRAGIRHVVLPFGNKRHVLDELPAKSLENIEVHYVKHVDEALAWSFRWSAVDGAIQTLSPQLETGLSAAASAALQNMAAEIYLPPRQSRL